MCHMLSFHLTAVSTKLRASQAALVVKNPSVNAEDVRDMGVQSLGQEDPLEKEMATHSSILAWRIPWTEEPGGLQSIGSQSQTQLKRLSTLAHTQHRLQYIFCTLALQRQGNIRTQDIVVLAFGF